FLVSGLERLVQHDGFHAVGAGGDHVDRHIAYFSNALEVAACIDRQLVVFSDAGSGFTPARQLLKDGLGAGHGIGTIGKHIKELALIAISDTDLQGFDAVKHIELGDAKAVDAIDHDRALHGCTVEPAAATRPPGNRAKLLADFGQVCADIVVQFSRKRAGTYPRG